MHTASITPSLPHDLGAPPSTPSTPSTRFADLLANSSSLSSFTVAPPNSADAFKVLKTKSAPSSQNSDNSSDANANAPAQAPIPLAAPVQT